jgi:probable H4MPT-linked C1 transfer pathway protein
MQRSVLGLDVGGANLKAANAVGAALTRPYQLWKSPEGLAGALRALLERFPPPDLLAVTMTGELCDCFETKRQGVRFILDAVASAAPAAAVRVWRQDGRLVDLAAARQDPLPVAAANWLALATWAGRLVPSGPALLVDIGSTTTDLVPLLDGRPVPLGRSDPERLRTHELVYTGVRRTPVCALLGAGAAEVFATTHDVFVLLGALPEDAADRDTADGRPATRPAAHARLARMLGADAETCGTEDTQKLAERVLLKQVAKVQFALGQVSGRLPELPRAVVVSGSGEFLARLVLAQAARVPSHVLSLTEHLGPETSEAACAYALAVLAAEGDSRGS